MELKIILTGASGYVGEGVLLECLEHSNVKEVLMLNRKHVDRKHPKLKETIVPDFMKLEEISGQLTGYNACFYCAGISSVGRKEEEYSHVTYDLTLHLAKKLVSLNPDMTFNFISGTSTDSSEKGKSMWARVKGKTENALMKLPFKKQYNFRPAIMVATPGQKNVKTFYKVIAGIFSVLLPGKTSTMKAVGLSMIHTALNGYPKQILEVKDIKIAATN